MGVGKGSVHARLEGATPSCVPRPAAVRGLRPAQRTLGRLVSSRTGQVNRVPIGYHPSPSFTSGSRDRRRAAEGGEGPAQAAKQTGQRDCRSSPGRSGHQERLERPTTSDRGSQLFLRKESLASHPTTRPTAQASRVWRNTPHVGSPSVRGESPAEMTATRVAHNGQGADPRPPTRGSRVHPPCCQT